MKSINILLLGCGGTAAHNYIRSLKESAKNYRIIGTDTNKYQGAASEVDKFYLVQGDKVALLKRIIELENIDFIHAQPDSEVLWLSLHREQFDCVHLPEHETIELCQDKKRTYQLLETSNVPVPVTHSLKQYLALQPSNATFWMRAIKGAGSKAALPVSTQKMAMEWFKYWEEREKLTMDDFIVSEFLEGKEYAWQSLWHKGVLVASVGRVRLEYLMGNITPSGQTSTPSVAYTVHNEELNRIGYTAIKSVDFNATGVFGIDAKEDGQGDIKITEINAGRFYSTSLFVTRCGLNLPDLQYSLYRDYEYKVSPFNSVPAGFYWVRCVDREPKIFNNHLEWKQDYNEQ